MNSRIGTERPSSSCLRLMAVLCVGTAFMLASANAWAFDKAAYVGKLEAVSASVKGKSLGDGKAALTQLEDMIQLGKTGAQDYGAEQPKFAKLMTAAVSDAEAMRKLTDAEIEDSWGENGSAGDAAGVPLRSLGQFDPTRASLELIVGPSHAYIFLKKWQTTHKAQLLDKTADELAELAEHIKAVK
jgi:hypothetical protein